MSPWAGMRCATVAVLLLLAPARAIADESSASPYELGTGFQPRGSVDVCVLAELKKHGIEPAHPCSDAVFLRRAYLDVIGTLPDPGEVLRFTGNGDPKKRAKLIDALLEREEFVDYWTMKWCDLLRVKAEFPINLWPNGVQAYYRWIHDQIRINRPYDAFARDLLTSSGSNFRVAPVNFYRAVQDRSARGLAAAVALTFMGERYERWPAERQAGMALFFSHVAYKPTAEWKEEIVIADPAPREAFEGLLPDGTRVQVAADEDPRHTFAAWLLDERNPHFARCMANRVWSWLFGRGVIDPPDDMRPDNAPSNRALLMVLERALVSSGYDVKALFRAILNSRTYQGSPIPRSHDPRSEALFAYYPIRRLDAEVLIDALCRLDGAGENYLSQVPEPFTILRGLRRTVQLADGSITSPFLEMFGRPARDTGLESERSNEPTDAQRLYLLNSSEVQRRLERSPWLRRIAGQGRRNRDALVRQIYTAILSRLPTQEEVATARKHLGANGTDAREPAIDLAWALINSKEFLYRH